MPSRGCWEPLRLKNGVLMAKLTGRAGNSASRRARCEAGATNMHRRFQSNRAFPAPAEESNYAFPATAAGEQIDIHRSARAVVEIDLYSVNFSSTPPFSRRIRRNYNARVLGRSYRTFQTDCPVSPIFRSVHGRTGSRRSKVCAASKQSGYGLRRLKGPVP